MKGDKPSDKAGANAARRLLSALKVPSRGPVRRRRAAPLSRPQRLHVEVLEPRLLLSGEAVILPPPPPQETVQAPIVTPAATLAAQIASQVSIFPAASNAAAAAAQPQAAATGINEVIVVDPSVADYQQLVNQALKARAGQQAPSQVEVVVLDPTKDGVEQVATWLGKYRNLDALHLITHGTEGSMALGTATLDGASLDRYSAALHRWGQALAGGADIFLYGCDVAAGNDGAAFIQNLARATGADVAASTDATGDSALGGNWALERHSGDVAGDGLFAQGVTYHHLLTELTSDTLTLNSNLRTQWLTLLDKLDAAGTEALGNTLINGDLPGLGKSVNELIGLDSDSSSGETIGLFGLKAAATSYFTAHGDSSTLSGLADALQDALDAQTTAIKGSTNQSWTVSVTPTFDPTAGEVVAGFNLKIALDWTKTGLTFDSTGIPTTNISSNLGSASVTGTLTARSQVNIDIDAGLVLGAANSVNSATVATLAAPGTANTWMRFNRFGVSAELTSSKGASVYHLVAGIETRLVDSDNSDGKNRVTLAELSSTMADNLATVITASLDGRIAFDGGDSTALGTNTQALFGTVVSGELTAVAYTDIGLDNSNVQAGMQTLFSGAKNLGSQMDVLSTLGVKLPFVDVSFNALMTLSDGRSLGDVLSFRTPQNTSVLDDYLAESGDHTLSGLLARLRQYLSGTGVYDGLEALLPAYAAASFIDVGSTGVSGSNVKLDLNLKLTRDFLRRFSFDDKLKAVGLDFQLGDGVGLEAVVDYDTTWTLALSNTTSSATVSSATIVVNTLDARVQDQDGSIDAGVVLGILDGRASGTVDFDTSLVQFSVNSGASLAAGSISSSGSDIAVSGTPTVKAAADFDVSGSLPTSSGTVSLATLAGGTPHVAVAWGSGTATGALASNWSVAEDQTLTVTTTNFEALQKFASLDATSLANMFTDLGTYLERLRDSGQFDALLPYTNTKLGNAVDFSAALNDLVDNQLITTLTSGITASSAISPVLNGNLSFDLQVQRPGESRTTVVTITVLASETTGFTHINQLAQLIDGKIAAALGGALQWTAGDGTAPTTAQAEVSETVKGGMTVGDGWASSEEQLVVLHASSGSFTLQLGDGVTTGDLSVLATATEVQHALESLPEIGVGNVLVTGTPKHYRVEFRGALAGRDMDALNVAFSNDAGVGGLLDVTAGNLQLSDGLVWGKLNILENVPGTFSTLRVAPSAGISVSSVTTGTSDTNAVQRLYVVYGSGGSFTLSGKKVDGSSFTTAAISLDGSGTWSTRIQDAINTAMGLTSSTGVSVAAAASSTADVNQGIQVFDITYSGSSVQHRAFDTLSAADVSLMKSQPGVQATSVTLRDYALAVGSSAAHGETQRLAISNASAGTFTLSLTVNSVTYLSDAVSWSATDLATDVKAALYKLMQQADTSLAGVAVADTDVLTVSNVSGLASGTKAVDISFGGAWIARDVPQIVVNTSGLTQVSTSTQYGNLTLAGFNKNGQEFQSSSVTTFVTLQDMVERFQQAVNASLDGATFSLSPRYDSATDSFLFDVKFAPTATTAVPLVLSGTVGDLSNLSVDASLDLTSQALFEGTLVIDFSELNTFALRAGGAYTGTLTASGAISTYTLSADGSFSLDFDGDTYSLTLAQADTSSNTAAADLVSDLQAVLDAQTVSGSSELGKRGFATVGDAVTVKLGSANQIQLVVAASVQTVTLTASSGSKLVTELGFLTSATTSPAPKAVTLASNGQLSSAATFSLSVDASSAVSVTVAADSSNTSTSDLIADINTALAAASVSGNSYLSGLGFSDLGDVVQARLNAGRIELVTQSHLVASLKISIASETNTAVTELGFTPGQRSTSSGAAIYLQNATLGGNWSAAVHDQTSSASTTLSDAGTATLGLLDLSFNKISADYQGSYSFELRGSKTQTTSSNDDVRISLDDLFNSVSGQVSQLGMGGSVSTSSWSAVSSTPASNGQLLRDVGLTVTIGSDTVTVTLTTGDTAGNTSTADLAADLNTAIHAALVAQLGSDAYASQTLVSTYNAGSSASPSYVLKFIAPTVTSTVNNVSTTTTQKLTVAGRLLAGDYMTDRVFAGQDGTGSASAGLELGGLQLSVPSSLGSYATPDSATVLTVDVSNLSAALGGTTASHTVAVVPSNGLGGLSALADVNWSDLSGDLGQLTNVFGDLGALGPYGQLGRALPLLNENVSDLFDLTTHFAAVDTALAADSGVTLAGLKAALAEAFGADAADVVFSYDSTSGAEALRINLPYRVVVDGTTPLDVLLSDDFKSLLSSADQTKLAGLAGTIAELRDADGSALLHLQADMTLHLSFGIDLSSVSAHQGKLFLYDHQADSQSTSTLSDDSGTFGTLTLSASASAMAFDANVGIMNLRVQNGTATVNVSAGIALDAGTQGSSGTITDRLYLGDFGDLVAAASASNATTSAKAAPGNLLASSFAVSFDGTAVASLPLSIVVSDDLGQLAIDNIDGFTNPMPVGTMDLAFRHLGSSFAKLGGDTSASIGGTQVAEAAKPPVSTTGNGSGDSSSAGAPADNDNEANLSAVDPNPLSGLSGGEGATTTSSTSAAPTTVAGSAPSTQPSSSGYDLSYVLPDLESWQTQMVDVIRKATGLSADPAKPINAPLLFLLHDPTVLVQGIDKILAGIQTGLDTVTSSITLPFIGTQLTEATQFVTSLRKNLLTSVEDALASTIELYGGLDNALRMYLFSVLAHDVNHDWKVDNSEKTSPLNFIKDYNGDDVITPDDIVVEYLSATDQTPRINFAGHSVPTISAGDRTAWVTSGMNRPIATMSGSTLTVLQAQHFGDYTLGFTSGEADYQTLSIAYNANAATIQSRLLLALQAANPGTPLTLDNVQVSGSNGSFSIGFANLPNGITAPTVTVADTRYTSQAGNVVLDKGLATLNVPLDSALKKSDALQFRMDIGQTFTYGGDLSFDIGVPNFPLSLKMDGGINLDVGWDFFLGFGVDLKKGFYIVTNMADAAGLGQKTVLDSNGIASGVVDNLTDDPHFSNLFDIGKTTVELETAQHFRSANEGFDYSTAMTEELILSLDVTLKGVGSEPFKAEGQLLFLNATVEDDTKGWVRDNTGAMWGEIDRTNDPTAPNETTFISGKMFNGKDRAEGSRSHLYGQIALDLQDPGKDDGRLTYSDFRNIKKVSDIVKFQWEVKAQLNLRAEFGITGTEGYLPTIHGTFHLFWGRSSADSDQTSIFDNFDPDYKRLFKPEYTVWISDVGLDMGSFFSKFLAPVAKRIQEVTDPIMPVIDALTTPIPGISDLMGRDYSVIDLARDMSSTFGGISQVDFIIALVNLLDVIDSLPTNGTNMIIPVSEVLLLAGVGSRQFNLSSVTAAATSFDLTGSTAGIPGKTTVSLSQGLQDFGNAMKKPGSALAFPILDNPFQAVVNLLLGKPADLMTFTPPDLEVDVGFRVSFPVYPPLYVGLGGSIKLQANLTLGFDTYGIQQFLKSGSVTDIFDGFYVSDNIVNGVDQPEVILTAKLYAFAELNAFIVRAGVEGGIKLVGTLDLYDEDMDNKMRASEIIAAVSDDPLDLVEMHLRGSAYVSAYVDLFALFDYVRVWEFTFFDVTLFEWEHVPNKKPILATLDGDTLTFNTGSKVDTIDGNSAIENSAADRKYKSKDDGNELYTLSQSGSSVTINATLPNGQSYTKTFNGVAHVRGYAGAGDDTFDASALSSIDVYFVAGAGTDVLIGGGAADILVGSDSGTATLTGNGGNDTLIARGGTTTMLGGGGDDTYRFLDAWGTANLYDGSTTDGLGANILDFSRQNAGITFDDSAHQALRGSNQVTWKSGTTIDQVKGGSGSDILDFSGDEANLLVTVTGANAGWVAASASGMSQSGQTASDAQIAAGDTVKFGFKFSDIENIVGGQGSDVFRIRDKASLSGNLYGDTSIGLHSDHSEAANARNTLDFSEYTTAVQVDEEGDSAFGGVSRIQVRGMHNLFGGAGADRLSGDSRNNLIVGNGGADTLEGRAGHDLLIADNFRTWSNETSRPSTPTTVSDYLSLESVGQSAGFGSDGRRWIWKGQSLENLSLSSRSQTLKGGDGNDILMGALGADVFNIGGSGQGNDVIMADLGKIKVDYYYRSAFYAETYGSKGGGDDKIYLGTGNNLVLAGNGNDTITGTDTKDSFNIILADNGSISFQTTTVTVSGQSKTTFATANGNNHLIDTITAPVLETGGGGGDDVVNLVSGSAIVFGGTGSDTITMTALASTGANVRFIAGDHGTLSADGYGGVILFQTLDTSAATGAADVIRIGDGADTVDRNLGSNYILGGMGADTILVSAHIDSTTSQIIQGQAISQDVLMGDNGSITRTASTASKRNFMLQAKTIANDAGGNDKIYTANGGKVILGGFGADTIVALGDTTRTVGSTTADVGGTNLVFGDSGQLDYDSAAQNGVLRSMASASAEIGGNDSITLGEGLKIVVGGYGDDTIAILGTKLGEAAGVAAVTGLAGVTSGTDDEKRGRSGRYVAGDNASISFDSQGGLYDLASTDAIPSTGGADTITLGKAGTTGTLGRQVVIGGMGGDTITVRATATSDDVLLGDNGEYQRARLGYQPVSITSTATDKGDADTITAGSGTKIVIGGYGNDSITLNTVAASSSETTPSNDSIVLGDSGTLSYDASGTGVLGTVSSIDTAFGGSDTVSIGDGDVAFIGGYGNDTLTVDSTQTAFRIAAGDNARLTYGGSDGAADVTDLLSLDQDATTGGSDTLRFGTVGGVTGDMGVAILMGGMGSDTLTVTGATANSALLGDNGEVVRSAGRSGNLSSFTSLLPDQGADDTLTTISATTTSTSYLIVGGAGADTLRAGSGYGVAFGDSGRASYSSGIATSAESIGIAQGGADSITLGSASASDDGNKIVFGGKGADSITLQSVRGTSATGGDRERVVAGDNGSAGFDSSGRLTSFATSDTDTSTAGNDVISIVMAGDALSGNPIHDYNAVAGGLGGDTVTISGAARSHDVIGGDNLDYRRSGGLDSFADVLQPTSGGDDTIRTGSGIKLILGGAGADAVTAQTAAGDRNLVLGDAGTVTFDSSGVLTQILSTATTTGGNDTLTLGAGEAYVVGGLGNDSISISGGDSVTRVAMGDNGQIDFDSSGVVIQSQATGSSTAAASTTTDAFILPSTGTNLVFGGTGVDTLSGSSGTSHQVIPGMGTWQTNNVVSIALLGEYNEMGVTNLTRVNAPSGGSISTTTTGTITGSGTLTEDASIQTVTGTLAYPAANGGSSTFVPVTGVYGNYGAFFLSADGAWHYTLDNTLAAVQSLRQGDSRTDSFIARTTEGSQTTVTITVLGANDAPVIASSTTGALSYSDATDSFAASAFTASATDADRNAALTWSIANASNGSKTGTYGTLSVSGSQFTFTPDATAINSLNGGVTATDTFTLQVSDGIATSTKTLTVTVTGANDAPSVSGTATGTVSEDATQTASGTLTASDVDTGESGFIAARASGSHGSLAIDAAGAWTYTLNNASVQSLSAGHSVQDLVTVQTIDGTSTQVTVTIAGSNDAPTLATPSAVTYTDTAADDAFAATTGTLVGSDVDSSDSLSYGIQGVTASNGVSTLAGSYGVLTVNSNGSYSYVPDGAAIQALTGNASESFSVVVSDGTATATATLVVNFAGANDTPAFSGTVTGAVTEDDSSQGSASGTLTVSDRDTGQGALVAQTNTAGSYGSFSIDASGAWSYQLDNSKSAVQALAAGQTLTDTFAVATAEGASQNVTVTIHGSNDAATFGGVLTGSVSEDNPLQFQAGGTATVSDVDSGESGFQSAVNVSGTYGSFQFTASTGVWTYSLNNASDAVQALASGQTVTDSLQIKSTDGTTTQIVITISGADEAATAAEAAAAASATASAAAGIQTALSSAQSAATTANNNAANGGASGNGGGPVLNASALAGGLGGAGGVTYGTGGVASTPPVVSTLAASGVFDRGAGGEGGSLGGGSSGSVFTPSSPALNQLGGPATSTPLNSTGGSTSGASGSFSGSGAGSSAGTTGASPGEGSNAAPGSGNAAPANTAPAGQEGGSSGTAAPAGDGAQPAAPATPTSEPSAAVTGAAVMAGTISGGARIVWDMPARGQAKPAQPRRGLRRFA